MTDSRAALYRAICANPDEDTPRLAYADLVEEEGNAAHAAFIRAQIAIARVPTHDPLFIATRTFDPDVLNGHAMTHALPPVPDGFGWHAFEFRRGFAWKVGVRSSTAFTAEPAIFEAAPIRALSIGVGGRSETEVLADWPLLERIERLEYSTAHFGADEADRLGHSPYTTRLTELAFDYAGISSEGLEALARSPLFPRLTSLDLRSTAMPPALLADALGAIRERGALVGLTLASNRITSIDAEHLFALPALQGLTRLDLSDNPRLGPVGALALAESGIATGLDSLDLERTHPGVPGMRALAETGALAGIRSLNLAANRLGPNAIKQLCQPEAVPNLRVLNLSENPLGDGGAVVLADTPELSNLLALDLSNTNLTDRGILALVESPYLSRLLRLDLRSTERASFSPAGERAARARFGNRVVL
jgi:uncharacterized protein (TIGR02996 family)